MRWSSDETVPEGVSGWAARVGEMRLARLGRALADRFGRTVLIATPGGGSRPEPDGVVRADLAALAEALPDGALVMAQSARDAAAAEGPVAGFVREAEAAPCALPAVLRPGPADDPASLLTEAAAAGFEPEGPGTSARARRPIGLDFSRCAEIAGDERVVIGAGVRWPDLVAFAARRGEGVPLAALADRYPRPIDAVLAGLFEGAEVEWFRGLPQSATVALPPADVGIIDRTWMMPDAAAAEAALRRTLARYRPVFAETIPSLDAHALRAAGLWRGSRRARRGAAGLRLVFDGTRTLRLAAMMSASWAVERAGGRVCQRGPLPPQGALPALAVAAGAARVELPAEAAVAERPEGAIGARRLVALRGRVQASEVLWYPRDLSRSLEQLRSVQGTEPPRRDGWDAVREALERALP